MDVNTSDDIKVIESLTNHKIWLGQNKDFPSVKVNPPVTPEEPEHPQTLSIFVFETVGAQDRPGGFKH